MWHLVKLSQAAHHQSTRMYREKPESLEYTEIFVQNKISFMHNSLIYFLKEENETLFDNKWCVSESAMLAWSSTILCKDGAPEKKKDNYFEMAVCTERYDLPGEDVPLALLLA